jgi:hypothetical protein
VITIREKSRQKFRVVFEDEDRQPFLPLTIRYRLDDKSDDCGSPTTIIDWTSVAPQTEIEITIPSEANRILNSSNAFERRVLTIQSDYDTDSQLSNDEEYLVRNLAGFN